MFRRFFNLIAQFFPRHLSYQLKELYWAASIRDLALAATSIFEPIYLYTIGFNLQKILWFFLGVYALYFFILPWGAKVARRWGYEHAIFYSSPVAIFYFLCLFGLPSYPWLIYPAIVSYAVYKALYWPAYHADFARFGGEEQRGRELSNRAAVALVIQVVGPILGGLLIVYCGFKILFVMVALLIFASNIPLLMTPEQFTPVPFSYLDAYRRLFQRQNWRDTLSYFGFGEELIAMTVWPVFIFVIIKNYLSVGSLIAGATLLTALVTLLVGHLSDRFNRRSLLRLGVFFNFWSWLFRLFTRVPAGIFLVDTLYRVSKNTVEVPMIANLYQRAKEESVMKSVVFFEMALSLGKVAAAVVVLLLFIPFPESWSAAFLVAGIMSLLYALL